MNISEETAKLKIINGGMEFRIDTLGKKSFPIAFIFPTANEIVLARHARNELSQEKSHGEKPAHASTDQKILNQATEAELIGFKPPLGGTLSLSDPSSGISAAINIDSLGIMHYGAIIPFRTFYKNKLTNADVNRVFSYEIKVNALPAPATHEGGSGGSHMSGGMNGGGGGMGGGHHGGGGGGGHSGGMGGGHGGEHKSNGAGYGNSDLYVSNQITKEMKFSFK
jgi:hypothetical protein